MGPVTDVPPLDRGSPETEQGPAAANPRIREFDRPSSSAPPPTVHGPRPGILLPNRSGDERSCLTLWKRDMRVDRPAHLVPTTSPPKSSDGKRLAIGWRKPSVSVTPLDLAGSHLLSRRPAAPPAPVHRLQPALLEMDAHIGDV